MRTWEKIVQFLRKRAGNPDFDNPEYVADVMLLGTVYSTATALKPGVPTELLLARFQQAGGTLAQYEAGLRYALTAGWLALDDAGTSVEFTQAGMDLYV